MVTPINKPDVIEIGNVLIKVKRSYLNKFMQGAILDEDLFFAEEDKDGYVVTSRTRLADMEKRLAEYIEREKALHKSVELNNKGIAFEKEGNEDAAIEVYEESLRTGYNTLHPYDRLIVIYRRRKDYQNELRIIKLAIDNFDMQKYKDRLPKTEKLCR